MSVSALLAGGCEGYYNFHHNHGYYDSESAAAAAAASSGMSSSRAWQACLLCVQFSQHPEFKVISSNLKVYMVLQVASEHP